MSISQYAYSPGLKRICHRQNVILIYNCHFFTCRMSNEAAFHNYGYQMDELDNNYRDSYIIPKARIDRTSFSFNHQVYLSL